MKKLIAIIAIAAGSTFLCACNISLLPQKPKSELTLYTLGTPANAVGTQNVPALKFGKISIPTYVDTPQIVTRETPTTVHLSETHQWAEPLARAIQRAIPLRVSEIVREKNLKTFSKIDVLVDRFDGALDGKFTLAARINIYSDNAPGSDTETLSRIFTISTPVRAANYSAYVEAMSAATDALARTVAEEITAK